MSCSWCPVPRLRASDPYTGAGRKKKIEFLGENKYLQKTKKKRKEKYCRGRTQKKDVCQTEWQRSLTFIGKK